MVKTYNEWLDIITNEVKSLLPKDAEYQVAVIKQLKNNGLTPEMLTIRKQDDILAPSIRLEPYYQRQQALGCSTTAIAQIIVCDYQKALLVDHDMISPDVMCDWNSQRDHVFCQLVNLERNWDRLRNAPYEKFGDMALVVRVAVDIGEHGIASVFVDNSMLDRWGITADAVLAYAKTNTPQMLPLQITSLQDKIIQLTDGQLSDEMYQEMEASMPPIYVITNTMGINGATCITYPNIEVSLQTLCGDKYVILPSSIHELIVLAEEHTAERIYEMTAMVKEANATVLEPEEILSDSVYTLKDGTMINLTEQMLREQAINQAVEEQMMQQDNDIDLEV